MPLLPIKSLPLFYQDHYDDFFSKAGIRQSRACLGTVVIPELNNSGTGGSILEVLIIFNVNLFNYFRFYGSKKSEASTYPARNMSTISSVTRPIITVTEFTPGNTPDKVRPSFLPTFQFFERKKLALNYFFSSSSSIGWEKGLIFLTHCFLNERLNFCLKTKTKSFFHTPEKNFQNPTCDKQKWQKEWKATFEKVQKKFCSGGAAVSRTLVWKRFCLSGGDLPPLSSSENLFGRCSAKDLRRINVLKPDLAQFFLVLSQDA